MSSILRCEYGEAPGCGECSISSLSSLRLRADIADFGGVIFDELPTVTHTGELELTGAVFYGAFLRAIQSRGTSLNQFDEGHVFVAVKTAHHDRGCIRG